MSKFSLPAKALSGALALAAKIIEARNTIPILGHVRLVADESRLTLTATDLDMEITIAVAAENVTAGAITMPVRSLVDIVRRLESDQRVTLAWGADADTGSMEGETYAHLTTGRSRFALNTLPAEDFPDFTEPGNSTREMQQMMLGVQDLATLLRQTAYAASNEETRYYLNGIYLHARKSDLVGAATNGHELAITTISNALVEQNAIPGVIIPTKTADIMAEILAAEKSGEVLLELCPTTIRMTVGNLVFASKLIDGTFPDYERVVPRENENRLTVNREALLAAAELVMAPIHEKSHALKLTTAEGEVTLSAKAENVTAQHRLPCDYLGTVGLEIGLNGTYLADTLKHFKAPEVTLHIRDAGSAVLFTAEQDQTQPTLTAVIMPMLVHKKT